MAEMAPAPEPAPEPAPVSQPGAAPLPVSLDVSAIPARPAGAGRYVIELARALASRSDVELALVCRRGDAARWVVTAPSARVLPMVPGPRPARLAYERLSMGRALGRLEAPALAVHHSPHYTMPRPMKGVARVSTIHDLTFFDHPEWHDRSKVQLFTRAIRTAIDGADAIVCVSEKTARRLEELFAPREGVYTIPHGVDRAKFAPFVTAGAGAADDRELLGRLGLGPDLAYVAHVGTIEPRKGLVGLVEAFGRLAETHTELRLVLAGLPGWGGGEVTKAVASLGPGARARVRELGYVGEDAVPALLRNARVVAYPSLDEGFGLPALEALSCGSLLVTTKGTPMSALASGAAYLSEAGDVAGLAAAIDDALSAGEEERARRRAAGLAVARAHSWEAVAGAHLEAYHGAVARRAQRRPQ